MVLVVLRTNQENRSRDCLMENDFVGLLDFAIVCGDGIDGIDEFSSSIQQVFWILEFSSSFCFVYM